MSDEEWEQLASTALTIGSSALDKIEKKLTLLSAKYAWAKGFDYRPIATQIHAIAGPARKTINSLNFRSKCVRAVLKVQNTQNSTEAIAELRNRIISNLEDVSMWQADSVVAFENEKSVNPSFRSNYVKEWWDFCGEWNSAKIEMKKVSDRSLESIYENSLMRLTEESKKSKIQWEPVLNIAGTRSRSDALLTSGFTVNFKRKPEQLTYLIDIPNLTNTEFNSISLDLMDLIEQVTGIKHVETGRDSRNSPNVLQVDLMGEFTMAQSKVALGEIDSYLVKRFPQSK
jgi:hypothetical protein